MISSSSFILHPLSLLPVSSKCLQECNEIVLAGSAQCIVEVPREGSACTGVALNGLVEGEREAVVHQLGTCPDTPERRRPDHVARGLAPVLNDPIARSDIVQEEIAEWADNLVAESGRNPHGAPIDEGACRSSSDRRSVTDRTCCLLKQSLTTKGGCGDRPTGR